MLFVNYMLRIDRRAPEKLFENADGRMHMGGRTMDACIYNKGQFGSGEQKSVYNEASFFKLIKAQNDPWTAIATGLRNRLTFNAGC